MFGAFLEVIKRRIEDFSEKSTLKSQIEPPKVKLIFLPKIPINEILSKIDDHVIAVDKVKLLQVRLSYVDYVVSQMIIIMLGKARLPIIPNAFDSKEYVY